MRAILRAEQLSADLLLADDRKARRVARSKKIRIAGALGILEEAATLEIVDLPKVIFRLQQTTFRVSPSLIQTLLKQLSLEGTAE
ncbi:MAG: hypothetical protein ACFB4I_16265 [Cyanophyceae cyanobacterium]